MSLADEKKFYGEDEDTHEDRWFRTFKEEGTEPVQYHRFMLCKGVSPGFQYPHFFGEWQLSEKQVGKPPPPFKAQSFLCMQVGKRPLPATAQPPLPSLSCSRC